MTPGGFQSFVAWRYLMARPRRVSRIAVWLAALLAAVGAVGVGLALYVVHPDPQDLVAPIELSGYHWLFVGFGVFGAIGALAGLAEVVHVAVTRPHRESRIARRVTIACLLLAVACRLAASYLVSPPPHFTAVSDADLYETIGYVAYGLAGVIFLGLVATGVQLVRARHRTSRLAWWLTQAGATGVLACAAATLLAIHRPEVDPGLFYTLLIVACAAVLFAAICAVFGVIRYYFTFFTTVPIGGVWIGVMALVIVLSVMSGFENDLQGKILGSNAHIQVTKIEPEQGDPKPFIEWKDVEKQIDAVPGVEASTPFVTSEAVVSANNNYATVIIKGILPDELPCDKPPCPKDPHGIGNVTNLVQDVDDHEKAMARMRPPPDDDIVMPPVTPPGAPSKPGVIDPAPSDMPGGAPPVDYSGGVQGVVDPAPSDFHGPLETQDPMDLSKPALEPFTGAPAGKGTGFAPDTGVHTLAVPLGEAGGVENEIVIEPEGPREAGRTEKLPGILVGKELVKTDHMYITEEVQVISPLSDPANPDAAGNPIPFHRDFRVAGIFYTGMYEYDLKYVYVPLETLQEFLDLGDAVDGIEVRLHDPDATDKVGAAIARAIGPGYTVRDWKDLNRNLFSALKLEKIAMFLVLAITILVASFSIIGNLIMVVVEKAKEIALLKTLGASDRGVMFLFVTQGFFIGVIGTVLGVVWGLALCWAAAVFGLPLNPDVYYIDRLPIHVEASSVMAIAAAGVLISVGATIYPAFVAARLRPSQGLRHD